VPHAQLHALEVAAAAAAAVSVPAEAEAAVASGGVGRPMAPQSRSPSRVKIVPGPAAASSRAAAVAAAAAGTAIAAGRRCPAASGTFGDRDNPKASKCLGVFGLSLRTTEEDLRHLFGRYGRLEDVQLVKDNPHQAVARICLHDATYAKERCHGKELDGRNMRCDFSITRRAHTPTPGVIYLGAPGGAPFRALRRRRGLAKLFGSRRRLWPETGVTGGGGDCRSGLVYSES
uniref:RRM domain-containing protein n=1 Tax=Macrostomum lignano TaxID=282301 RepID=A0A1I8FQK7_9PLAT